MLDNTVKGRFMTPESRELLKFSASAEDLLKYISEYDESAYDFSVMRKVGR